jgi:hypothetical protein
MFGGLDLEHNSRCESLVGRRRTKYEVEIGAWLPSSGSPVWKDPQDEENGGFSLAFRIF